MKRGYPRIILIKRSFITNGTEYLVGTTREDDLLDGREAWYRSLRAIPYSDVAWEICQEHVLRREALEAEYDGFMKVLSKVIKVHIKEVSTQELPLFTLLQEK